MADKRQESSRWALDIASDDVVPGPRKYLRWLKTILFRGRSIRTVPENTAPLRSTAYLDGLRGFAAFLVYWHHHELWVHASQLHLENAHLENSFGWGGKYYFCTFYGISNFFSGGHMAVAIFYVISGYVLCHKPLSLIHNGEHMKAADSLGSSLFRRWFRLFIPCAATTFILVTLWHVFGVWNAACPPLNTYREEVWRWYSEFKQFSFIFRENGVPWLSYNMHLWSIPLEMRGSVIVWTVLMSLLKATVRMRLLCEIGLILYFIYVVDAYYGAMFISGMMQCELDLLAKLPDGCGFPRFLRRLTTYKMPIVYTLFAISMFLSDVPAHSGEAAKFRENPGWYYLSFLKPQAMYDPKWFFLFFAANMLVIAVKHIDWLRRFFETNFCQWLGKIAFSLYLVHGPILTTIGDRIYYAVGWIRFVEKDNEILANWINIMPLPKSGPLGLEVSFLVPNIILLPLTLWVADVVTRLIDTPSLHFAQWFYKKTFLIGKDEPPPSKQEDAMRLA